MKERFSILYATVSNMGKVRTNNEDNLFVDGKYLKGKELDTPFAKTGKVSGEGSVFAVCDGMGGEEYGEDASLTCVETLYDQYFNLVGKKVDLIKAIEATVNKANDAICKISTDKGKRVGTTLAMVVFRNNKMTIANLGDSRIYLYRNNEQKQLSEDHTQVQTLLRSKSLTEEAAKTHPSRNQLTQHLGIFPEELIIEPHILLDQIIMENDRWLICSDGLTDLISDAEISKIFSQFSEENQACDELVKMALDRGAHDNVTCIVLQAVKKSTFAAILG